MHKTAHIPQTLTPAEARSWALVGMFSALALILSYAETFIPLPIPFPGIKLGLANVAILVTLALLDFKSAFCVAVVKVLAAGFLFGSPVMIIYSISGTLLSLIAMALCLHLSNLHIIFTAIIGAIFHNIGQLFVASLMLTTALVWVSFPLLLVAACLTGALTGSVAKSMLAIAREVL